MSEYMRQFLVALSDYDMVYLRMMGQLIEDGSPTEIHRSVLKGYREGVIAAAKQLESDQ